MSKLTVDVDFASNFETRNACFPRSEGLFPGVSSSSNYFRNDCFSADPMVRPVGEN
jgi:hypothetical protein